VQISRECTPPYLPTGISNLLQPAQAEVMLGQLSAYLASWKETYPTFVSPSSRYWFSAILEKKIYPLIFYKNVKV
jgi:hypothetical protein